MKKCLVLLLTTLLIASSLTPIASASSTDYLSYFESIDDAEHIKSIDVDETIVDNYSVTTMNVYDVLIRSLDCENWEEVIEPFRNALKSAGFEESIKKDSYNQNEYLFTNDKELFIIKGEKASQAVINEGGLVYIHHGYITDEQSLEIPEEKTDAIATDNLLVETNGNIVTVYLNGNSIDFDVLPQLINNRTMVPVRAIFEALGATVNWNDKTQTVISSKDNTTIKLTINDTNMYVNNTAVTLDSPACLIGSRTLVPLRAISEAFGVNVEWKDTTPPAPITYDDISANITQITSFINQGMYLEAIQECKNAKSWHKLSHDDVNKINALENEAQTKYNEYQNAEKEKMIDVYASVLLRQYRSKMKDPSSFKLNAVYAGYNSSIYSDYDFVAVVDVSGKNSYGGITRSTYTMLLKTSAGKYILDLKDYADDMADSSWGASKIAWMDVSINALKIQSSASSSLKRLDTDLITRLVLSN